MNRAFFLWGCLRGFCIAVLLLSFSVGFSFAQLSQPKITQVELDRTNVVVHVEVPSGLRKMTLLGKSRVAGSAWTPRAVKRLDGNGGSMVFQLPLGAEIEVLRVQGEENEPLPLSFFTGTNHFFTQVGMGGFGLGGGPTDGVLFPSPGGAAETSVPRTVVESDIYRLKGDTLYLYNQMRGLQVIDLADSAAPRLTGTYSRPAAGEQMYLLDSGEAVLLCNNDCASELSGELLVLSVSSGVPDLSAKVPLLGRIQDSRLVGSVLYLISGRYEQTTVGNSTTWNFLNIVTSIDLADPKRPAVRDTLSFDGWSSTIMATDRFLFLAEQSPATRDTELHVIDISSPDGKMTKTANINIKGTISDKFKMDLNGDVFTVISLEYDPSTRFTTVLTTFSLSDPIHPIELGSLKLAEGELLHATRFDGDKVYVVTFRQIDPLWVVDLSDPSKPAVKGELRVPGWSTYLHPLGDRLLSVGIEVTNGWHATVSLFDVERAANPLLIDRVKLGGNWSWSEALNDEKAFKVIPEAGLILMPAQFSDTNGHWITGMQLIDFSRSNLVMRGIIPQSFAARRADVHQGSILSISASSLLTVDATDRDHPLVKNNLPLSWSLAGIEPYGSHLVQIAWDGGVQGGSFAQLMVSPTNDTSRILSQQTLPTNWIVWGTTRKADRLYILQGITSSPFYIDLSAAQSGPTNRTQVLLSVWDLSRLPNLVKLAESRAGVDANNVGSAMRSFWTGPDTLVWGNCNLQQSYRWGWPIFWGAGAQLMDGPWWYGGSSTATFFTFDVAHPETPQILSALSFGDSSWTSTSDVFQNGSLLYFSHSTNFFADWRLLGWAEPKAGSSDTTGDWVSSELLDVVDFSDPSLPTLRSPVSLPGRLAGISHSGAMIYSVGPDYARTLKYDYAQFLTAAAYDGVSAFKVDMLPLGEFYRQAALVVKDRVCLSFAKTNYSSGYLEAWKINPSGRFERLAVTDYDSAPTSLKEIGDLVAMQVGRTVSVSRLSDNSALETLFLAEPSGCVYPQSSTVKGDPETGFWISLGDYGPLRLHQP